MIEIDKMDMERKGISCAFGGSDIAAWDAWRRGRGLLRRLKYRPSGLPDGFDEYYA